MKIKIIILLLFTTTNLCIASEKMTNSDIVKLNRAGLSEATIVEIIKKSSNDFDLSTDAIIELKKENVSEIIIKIMLDTKKTPLIKIL